MGLGWLDRLELRSGMAGDIPQPPKCLFRAESTDRMFLYNLEKLFLNILVKSQTAPPKMTARTVRSFHVFIKNHDLGWYLPVKLVFSEENQHLRFSV